MRTDAGCRSVPISNKTLNGGSANFTMSSTSPPKPLTRAPSAIAESGSLSSDDIALVGDLGVGSFAVVGGGVAVRLGSGVQFIVRSSLVWRRLQPPAARGAAKYLKKVKRKMCPLTLPGRTAKSKRSTAKPPTSNTWPRAQALKTLHKSTTINPGNRF